MIFYKCNNNLIQFICFICCFSECSCKHIYQYFPLFSQNGSVLLSGLGYIFKYYKFRAQPLQDCTHRVCRKGLVAISAIDVREKITEPFPVVPGEYRETPSPLKRIKANRKNWSSLQSDARMRQTVGSIMTSIERKPPLSGSAGIRGSRKKSS